MRSRRRHVDRLGAAMFVGALIGFALGVIAGFSSEALDQPVVLPFAGAAIGVAVGALLAGSFGFAGWRGRGRREATERALAHDALREEAHRGWIDDIDLTADAPPPPQRYRDPD